MCVFVIHKTCSILDIVSSKGCCFLDDVCEYGYFLLFCFVKADVSIEVIMVNEFGKQEQYIREDADIQSLRFEEALKVGVQRQKYGLV